MLIGVPTFRYQFVFFETFSLQPATLSMLGEDSWSALLALFRDTFSRYGYDHVRVLFVCGFMVALELPYLALNTIYALLRYFKIGDGCRIQPVHKRASGDLIWYTVI